MAETMIRGRSFSLILKHLSQVFLIFLLSALGVASGHAATLSWSGGSGASGNWTDIANWGFVGTPANGDTLIFPGGAARVTNTNNVVGLTVNAIIFAGVGGGYNIFGNAFTVTNRIEATNTVAGTRSTTQSHLGRQTYWRMSAQWVWS